MQKRTKFLIDAQGRPVSGATVKVTTYPGGADATIYSDDGVTVTANPLTTDAKGRYEYYAANGRYTEVPTTNLGAQPAINDILFDDSLTSNQQFVAATGTGDAMVVSAFSSGYTLADGDEIRVRAPGANTLTAPTINLPGVGTLTIFRQGGTALLAGDIVASGHEILLRYRAAPQRMELVADAGWMEASRVRVVQSGSAASLTVEEKLRQTKAVLDFVTDDAVRAGIVAGTDVSDHSTYLQAALDAGYDLDFQGYTFYGNNLTDDNDQRSFVSSSGVANIYKNANGPLFTETGGYPNFSNIIFRGAGATYTGDNLVMSGANPIFSNCGSRDAAGRALKATGGAVKIYGSNPIWQTFGTGATDYDIEIGVSGTATLYHSLVDIYTSQPTGGVLTIDTGETKIIGGQIGKLTVQAGTRPAGSGGGAYVGVRIIGDVSVDLSGSSFSSCHLAGNLTFETGTSGHSFGVSNSINGTLTNNGNANSAIMRSISAGSYQEVRFGDDTSLAYFRANPSSPGQFRFNELVVPNNAGYRLEKASGVQGASITMSTADNLGVTNSVTGKALQLSVTGTASGSVIQGFVGGSSKMQVGAGGFHRINSVSADKGDNNATLAPSSSEPTNVWATALAADRTVTLSTTSALNGMKFRVIRKASATGAFNLNVGTGPLKALGIGEWCDVEYDGSAWFLAAYGAL